MKKGLPLEFLKSLSFTAPPVLYQFIQAPRREPSVTPPDPSEAWFGLKAYVESDLLVARILGWITVLSLSTAVVLVSCLIVTRLATLWDLWFEEIRKPDQESTFQRFLRVLSFWLAVLGVVSWLTCKTLRI